MNLLRMIEFISSYYLTDVMFICERRWETFSSSYPNV